MEKPNNNNNNNNEAIDEDLYSRQLYVMGKESMKKIVTSKCLISGMGGLGVEIAKNVVLGGCKQVTIQDTKKATMLDLSSQFYLSEKQIGMNRAEATLDKLAELNSLVKTDCSTEPLSEKLLSNYNVVVITEYDDLNQLIPVASFCHSKGIRLIICNTKGLFGQIFCDFGEKFQVVDQDGEQPVSGVIESVTYDDDDMIVTVTENGRRQQGFQRDDLVMFSDVRGSAQEINKAGPLKISKLISPFVFEIEDGRRFGDYAGGGVVTQVKQQLKIDFESLKKQIDDPDIIPSDFAKMQRQKLLHFLFVNISKVESVDELFNLAFKEDIIGDDSGNVNDDRRVIGQFFKQKDGQICPMNAVIGGVAAQEVLKAITGKFTPLKQWLYFDALECLPYQLTASPKQTLSTDSNRYVGQEMVIGRDLSNRLAQLKVFLVGSGAIGCEMLKNLAMMGVGSANEGSIVVTDMDLIERSNLNRQFLFRSKDIQQPKSLVAAQAVTELNGDINIEAHQNRVGKETESIYNDDFFESLDVVINALDNVEARRYMDSRCVFYRKPLLESGTLGTKANVQVVLPDLTESYSSSQDPPESSFPMCTIKNFPTAIEHTLAWAREMFSNYFETPMKYAVDYQNGGEEFLKQVKHQKNASEIIHSLHQMLVKERPQNIQQCVQWAREQWQDLFHNQIQQILYNFPPDSKTSQGLPFWSGTKRCPTVQNFDINNVI